MHNKWSESELHKDAKSLDSLCHQNEGPNQMACKYALE